MRRPSVPRHMRASFLAEVREARATDCRNLRRPGFPRCGRCFGCDMETVHEMLFCGASGVRH